MQSSLQVSSPDKKSLATVLANYGYCVYSRQQPIVYRDLRARRQQR